MLIVYVCQQNQRDCFFVTVDNDVELYNSEIYFLKEPFVNLKPETKLLEKVKFVKRLSFHVLLMLLLSMEIPVCFN